MASYCSVPVGPVSAAALGTGSVTRPLGGSVPGPLCWVVVWVVVELFEPLVVLVVVLLVVGAAPLAALLLTRELPVLPAPWVRPLTSDDTSVLDGRPT